MSGVKQTYVCVDEDELLRLKDAYSHYLALRSSLPEKVENIRANVQDEMQDKLRRIEKRQTEYQQFLYDLNGDLRYMEIENQRRLSEQNRKFAMLRDEYFDLLHKGREEYISLFKKQEEKFSKLIENEKSERKEAESQLQKQINDIVSDNQKKMLRVKAFTEELEKLINENALIPHERFAPGRMQQLKKGLSEAQADSNAGFYETALTSARNTYWQLVEMKTEVLQKEQEFITLFTSALEETECLIEKSVSNRKRKMEFGKSNEKKQFEIDIDYWTNGLYNLNEQSLRQIKKDLIKNEDSISIKELKEVIPSISEKAKKMEVLIEEARENILSSQLRANLAQKAVKALKEQLFSIEGSTYEENDPRKSFFVKVKNRAGSEIVTIISPVKGEFGKNELRIHSFDDKLVNESALNERATEISKALQKQGLDVGELKTLHESSADEFRDIEKIKKKKEKLA